MVPGQLRAVIVLESDTLEALNTVLEDAVEDFHKPILRWVVHRSMNVFNPMRLQEIGEFSRYELGTIVRHQLIGVPIPGEQILEPVDEI